MPFWRPLSAPRLGTPLRGSGTHPQRVHHHHSLVVRRRSGSSGGTACSFAAADPSQPRILVKALRWSCITGLGDWGCCTGPGGPYCYPCRAVDQWVPGPLAGTGAAVGSGIGPDNCIPIVPSVAIAGSGRSVFRNPVVAQAADDMHADDCIGLAFASSCLHGTFVVDPATNGLNPLCGGEACAICSLCLLSGALALDPALVLAEGGIHEVPLGLVCAHVPAPTFASLGAMLVALSGIAATAHGVCASSAVVGPPAASNR